MKRKFTLPTLLLCFFTTMVSAQWQQVGYMIVNGADTVNGANMIRGIGNAVYGCTTKGIFRSNDNGQSWTNISYNAPVILNESINCIFAAMNGDLYAGSTRRLYKSIDNGSTWSWLNTLPDSLEFNDVTEINGTIIASYKVAFATGGAYYSSDAGLTWNLSGGLPNNPKWHFLVDGNVVYLGSNGGVYQSTDNGQTWSIAGSGFSGGGFRDVLKSGNSFFAGDVGGNGLFGSYDNAATWANVDPTAFNGFCQIFSATAASDMILAAMDGTCNPGGNSPIKMSADTGHSWTVFMNNLPASFYSVVGKNSSGTSFFTKQGNGKLVYRYDLVLGITSTQLIQPGVFIFPNPVSSVATISISGEPKNYSFLIFNLPGELVSRIQITDSETRFDTGNLAPGVYFYQLRDEQKIYAVGKLIVQ